jgi:ABC-type multidrug transport system fused ATPase/permease subunit
MMLFLLISVAVYSYANIFSENTGNTSSGLALLIQYTIQLSNYLLFFTMSIWEIKGQAVSLERVKPYLVSKQTVAERIAAADSVINKLRKNKQINSYKHSEKPLIDIRGLSFAYESNPNAFIFKEMSFRV